MKRILFIAVICLINLNILAKKKTEVYEKYSYGIHQSGTLIELDFQKGKSHNHPLFAIWLADSNGKYIQTLYVSKSIGKGEFEHVNRGLGKWEAGKIQRPATLPYWAHQRNILNEFGNYIPSSEKPLIDAYTGATPGSSFTMTLSPDAPLDGVYYIYLELNQSWDWNEFWTNNKYPGDKEYKTSSQPALVYCASINSKEPGKKVNLVPIGHSHYSGADGSLNSDLSSLTTALKIADKISVRLIKTK